MARKKRNRSSSKVVTQPPIRLDGLADERGYRTGQDSHEISDLSAVAEERGYKADVQDPPIRLSQEANERGFHAKKLEVMKLKGGIALAWGMIGLILVVLALISIYAWTTFPDDSTLSCLKESSCKDGSTAYRELHGEWFQSVKDLIQLLVVSLLVPLLATLLGFIFGQQSKESSGD